ncbi:MAG: 50S ribosomal protein L11 methyltransferase [Sulfurospirillum sp.]|nr:MAG: 50S ribosomal protein L11 methyltransferase [Sulfurospirillum sp.]
MGEYYFELIISPSNSYELFLELLLSFEDFAVEERKNSIIIRDSEDLNPLLEAVESFAKAINTPYSYSLKKVKNEDWISKYQNSINPVEVGSFYIRPMWKDPKKDKIDIIINPALAFGSGHHETTASCLQALDKYVQAKKRVLDVGCGSGILSIASAKKGAIVDICDTDPQAIESALQNFSFNSVQVKNHWVGSASKSDKKYDIVIANIIADIIILIKKDLKDRLDDNGILILSGIIDDYFHKVKDNFSEFNIIENITKGEWHTLVLKKG